jgi:dihydroxyacetone kinase-like protein
MMLSDDCSNQLAVFVTRSLVGNFVTSHMADCSATVSMLDEEMKRLWDAPVHTAALRWGM